MNSEWLKVFDKPIKYLKVAGIWIDKDSPRATIIVSSLMHLFLVDIYMICSVIYLFTIDNIEDFSEAMSIQATLTGVCIKTLYFVFKKQQIEQLLNSLVALIEHESWIDLNNNGVKLQARVAQIDRIFKIFMSVAVVGVLSGSIVPFVTHIMPYKMWFPYDFNNNELAFWLSVLYQIIPGCIYAPATIIIDTFPAILICFLTGMLEVLCHRLDSIKHGDKGNLKELTKCIEIQLKLEAFQIEIGNIFGRIIWAQGFMSTLILCTTSFSLTVVSQFQATKSAFRFGVISI